MLDRCVDSTALTAAISEVAVAAGLPPVLVSGLEEPARATASIEVPFSCPKGKWCTAGLVVDCPLGTYNPLEDQDFATACILVRPMRVLCVPSRVLTVCGSRGDVAVPAQLVHGSRGLDEPR